MGTEIERKYLVTADGWRASADEGVAIRQFYLAARPGFSARIRILEARGATLTIKTGGGLCRGEYEYPIPLEDARELEAARIGSVVAKRRHRVPLGALTLEVDVFDGPHAPLVLGEIELPSVEARPALPIFLGREVTDDTRYTNAALAVAGRAPEQP
ncbi:CYTH domain-containing protein [Aureimonas mangrovi]|uniref:CYTH domain-containing protein n=1 Tax=Aureimonas mangrovi TaxID=2758041 RepID=UPI00163DB454|nr:CYTH domain-containing protein [Aureimonas mangrovi]